MMMRKLVSCCVLVSLFFPLPADAQVTPAPGGTQATPAETPAEATIIVQRRAMRFLDPVKYQAHLKIMPSQYIQIIAPRDGVITDVSVEPGRKIESRTEMFRFEAAEEELLVKEAQAELALEKLKLSQAQSAEAKALAEAAIAIAETRVALAELRRERSSVRTEREAVVYRVYAVPREFVTKNQVLAETGIPDVMQVEIPMRRSEAVKGNTVTITVEDREIDAKVAQVFPASKAFEPLHDIYDSLVSARLEIDNKAGNFEAGQTVYVPLIPRDYVTEVPNASIAAAEEGVRKIQVLRDLVVRDIEVKVLAPIGAAESFVSGKFEEGDELIVSSSVTLADGTLLSHETIPSAQTKSGTGPATNTSPTRTPGGF
ncbi:MAG TPA: hypothetical protein VMM56_10970 [Planctomycetaceae bacterium]|nr:hypothetical protein [Planctomycetaceae bacterium]